MLIPFVPAKNYIEANKKQLLKKIKLKLFSNKQFKKNIDFFNYFLNMLMWVSKVVS